MYKNTQDILDIITFDYLFKRCMKEHFRGSDQVLVQDIVLLLSITTGFRMEFIQNLRWKDILELGSENDAEVKKELNFRKYPIPIHPKVADTIGDIYSKLGYPNLETSIIDKLPPQKNASYRSLSMSVIRVSASNLLIPENRLDNINFESYTQILFGRKVFQVNGYSKEFSKSLKQHFELRSNKELFDFLGFSSKKEIKYSLSDINLNAKSTLIKLEDKNFNNGSHFQKFTAFSRFLLESNNFYDSPVTNSIKLLLLTSLFNGVRPSTLIRLKWHDIVDINMKEKSMSIHKSLHFDTYSLKITEEIRKLLTYHFAECFEKIENKKIKFLNPVLLEYQNGFDLNRHIFVMNTYNPITQPSLSREIKKALIKMKFPHANKIESKSTLIMFGRRIIEIKGDHKPTIKALKEHFKFRSEKELFKFLKINREIEKGEYKFKGKIRETIFEDILYDL